MKLKELPSEIWLQVLTYLDYFELKPCIRINRTFQALISRSPFDRELFRSKQVTAIGGRPNPRAIILHPIFTWMMFECVDDVKHIMFHDSDLTLPDFMAANEQATSPPVHQLQLQIHNYKRMTVTNKDGVTVLQVMTALCQFFSNDRNFGRMGDHTGWTGWDEKKLTKDGNLLLRADNFDS